MKTAPRILAFVFVLLVAACASSPAARIREKTALFQSLSPDRQAMIRNGEIEEGFSVDMVYLALGRPSAVEKSGASEKWIYRNYYPSERVAGEGLYAKPGSSAPSSSSVRDAVGKPGGFSDASAHGGYSEGASLGGAADVSGALMEVWFTEGRVSSFRLTP
jgi:hypothetical protein